MVDLEENRDTGRYVEPLRRDRRESHLPAIREQKLIILSGGYKNPRIWSG